MRNIFRFLGAVLLCGAASTPAAAQELTVDELEMLMPGTTIETTNRGDWDFYITFNEDGTLDARIDANREILDGGVFTVEIVIVSLTLSREPSSTFSWTT